MKRFLFSLSMVFFCLLCEHLFAQNLVSELRALGEQKKQKQISEIDYETKKNEVLKRFKTQSNLSNSNNIASSSITENDKKDVSKEIRACCTNGKN